MPTKALLDLDISLKQLTYTKDNIISQLQSEIATLQNEKLNLSKLVDKQNEQIQTLRQEVSTYKDTGTTLTSLQQHYNQAQMEIISLNKIFSEQYDKWIQQNSQTEKQLDYLNQQQNQAQKELTQYETLFKEFQILHKDLPITEILKTIGQVSQKILLTQTELDNWQDNLTNAESTIQTQMKQITSLTQALDLMPKLEEEHRSLTARLEKLMATNSSLTNQVMQLQQDNNSLTAQNNSLMTQNSELMTLNDLLMRQIQELSK